MEEIKRAVTVPVIAVGRFTEPQYAELLVRQGRADLIAFGRQSIADPELPNRARDGQLETLAPCIGCLLGCVPNMLSGRPITCAVNPLVGRELEWGPAGQKKRVAVVGGGPGGLYAAWACARRGHQVVLLEQGEQLGGTLRIASFPTGKGQISAAVRSMIVRCQQAGVEIRTGTRATPELLRQLAPDAAILATGSGPLIPPIPGLDSCGFVTAQDMLEGRAVVGAGVLVVGGGMIGCEATEFLGERGHRVAVVEMREDIAADVRPEHRRCLLKNLRESQVLVRTGARVERFYPDGVDYVLADGTEGSLRGYDSVVLAMGTRSREELRERIAAFVPQVLVVGEGGQDILSRRLREIQEREDIHFTVVNGENASGVGITPRQARGILEAGADVITLGNHTWNRLQIADFLDSDGHILRPANYAGRVPGRGFGVFRGPAGVRIGVLNLMGRLELNSNLDSPFQAADRLLRGAPCDVVLVDFHAEATSEKGAMAWYLDGRTQAVWGTHTHVPTADCQLLPKGTGFVTDLGMTGPYRSVLGIRPEHSMNLFLGGLPRRYEEAEGPCKLEACRFTIDTEKKRCVEVRRADLWE